MTSGKTNQNQVTMIEEIWKRPFARPLGVWIAGILLYTCGWARGVWIGVLALVLVPVLCLAGGEDARRRQYQDRWLWGATFVLLTLSLSVAVAYYRDIRSERIPERASIVRLYAREAQLALLEKVERLRLSDEEKGVVAALTLGYTRWMDWETRQRFSLTGVAHILSVSGFHVAVVCGFLSFLCAFFPRGRLWQGIRYLLLMTGLWFYVFMTGLAPPSIRSGLMLSFYLTGKSLRRTTDGYNTLAAAAFCMLVYDPAYLFDIGFQLSYLAVYFILFLVPRLNRLIEVRNPLLATPWGWVTVSIAAQAGTTLLCFYYFKQFPLVFLLTNLPVSLFATALLPVAVLWFCVPETLWGYEALRVSMEGLTRAMVWIVDVFSEFPYAVFIGGLDGLETVMGYVALVCGLCYLKGRNPKSLLAALLFLLILSLKILLRIF